MKHEEYNEAEVIKLCLKRDRAGQKALYDRYAGKLLSLCFRYSRDRMEAEDLLQEGFIRIFDNLYSYGFKGSFDGWLRRVMISNALNHYKRTHQIRNEIEITNAEEIEYSNFDEYEGRFELKELMQLVNNLPTQYKTVFNLFAIDGYNHKEISEMLNISEGGSKSNLSRARQILVNMLKQKELYLHETLS